MKSALSSLLLGLCCTVSLHAEDRVDFTREISTILSDKCFACHGPDKKALKAKLRLDLRDEAVRERDGLYAIAPGKPEDSELLKRILSTDPDEVMPPPKTGKKVSAHEAARLRAWIAQGAEYREHWAFVPPERPDLPRPKKSDWIRNPIDAFVLARLESEGLSPSREAERTSWLRRVSFDLTGLPPTLPALDAFLADRSTEAHARAVDRLLASPHYGEHMTRYWLDAARYADTNGYQYDKQREQWVWRDWVIHAFNSNMGFDRFTIEQMAGDLLPDATDQTRLATGFHRNHPITIEGGVIDEEYRTEYVIDRVVTTSTVWMGLTMICARCHDHKYDPVSTQDFYRLYAFFNQVPERGMNGFDPRLKVPSPLTGQNSELGAKLAAAEKRYTEELQRAPGNTEALARWEQQATEQLQQAWTVVVPEESSSQNGATLTLLDDQSLLAGGKNPATDTYTLRLPALRRPVTHLRLEAIRHPSLTNGSTSRGSNGNFVLSEFEVSYRQGEQETRVKISEAEADYEQQKFWIRLAIDGKANASGWAVDGNSKPGDRLAVFRLAEPVPAGAVMTIRMIHNYGASHQIGRFRLATASSRTPFPPLPLQAILRIEAEKRSPAQGAQLARYLTELFGSPALKQAAKDLEQLRAEQQSLQNKVPTTMVMAERPGMRKTHVLERGEYDKPREEVQAAIPTAFGALPPDQPANRLGFARWLVDAQNPLTARVTVNRFWQQLFGIGIVKTSEDFGLQSAWPSHPELLDWLAVDFMESGWDVKRLLKQIVLSASYRQDSRITPASHARDPENRLLARGPRMRLDGEAIRDTALYVSGLLNPDIGGPSVYPYHPEGLWLELNNRPGYSRAYPHPKDEANLYRRSMYTFWKRTVPPPSMASFDAPEREFCMVRRSRTNTPLQAFILMHDPQFVEAARFLGERMMREGGRETEARLRLGFRVVTARQPDAAELAMLRETYTEWLEKFRADPDAARRLLSIGQRPRDPGLDLAEHAAFATVARMLLNLSETITKG